MCSIPQRAGGPSASHENESLQRALWLWLFFVPLIGLLASAWIAAICHICSPLLPAGQ
jgi:hypothetical protein